MSTRPKRPWLARALVVVLLAALLLELAVRWVLFSPSGSRVAEWSGLRSPDRFAHRVEDLYWSLTDDFARAAGSQLAEVPVYDSELGWTGGWAAPDAETWRHRDDQPGDARRTILLYGDSFSACASAQGTCFQDHLAASPEGATHRLLNQGVGGYGVDQALVMLERTLWRYPDATVVFGLLVDDDLDRCAIDHRGWPKPRFERRGDGWTLVPAAKTRPEPPFWAWYGLRLALHTRRIEPTALHRLACPLERIQRENRARCRYLFERLASRLAGRPAFAVLFFGQRALTEPEFNEWREPFVVELLDELGLPWVSTRAPLLAHAEASGRSLEPYFLENGHLSSLGNQVALRAITEGVAGRFAEAVRTDFEPGELIGPLAPDQIVETRLGGEGAAARYEFGFREPFGHTQADRSRLCFRAGSDGPTSVRYDLAHRARSFQATARFIPVGQLGPGEGSVDLWLEGDGETLASARLVRGNELALDVDLTGRSALVISVDDAGDGPHGDWIYLADPRFD